MNKGNQNVGTVQCEGNLAEIRKITDELTDQELKSSEVQKQLLHCCGDRAAQIALLMYLVVVRGTAVKWIIKDIKVIDGSTIFAKRFERKRQYYADLMIIAVAERMVEEAGNYLLAVVEKEVAA